MARWEQNLSVILSAILVAGSLLLLINDCIQVANDGSIEGKEIIGLVIFVVTLAIWVYYLIVSIKKLKQSGK
ncbi:MAG: hypothetical protein VZR22_01055 [Candidatus Cryptobacteroides sp.]|nr:hypothetical protein [Candidatus Cryptobacteroides sp.]